MFPPKVEIVQDASFNLTAVRAASAICADVVGESTIKGLNMNIPGLGKVTKDESIGWHYSEPVKLEVLKDKECRVVLDGYDEDAAKEDFHSTIANFLSIPHSVLKDAEVHIYRYYQDVNAQCEPDDEEFLLIESPGEVWKHVDLGDEPIVSRCPYGDRGVYVSLECNCDWEPEHGLQIVFKNGAQVSKVGPYDGHLTHKDANVVYR